MEDAALHCRMCWCAMSRRWDNEMLQDAVKSLLDEFPLSSDVPGGMPEYRRSLTVSFFFKFYWTVKGQLPGLWIIAN